MLKPAQSKYLSNLFMMVGEWQVFILFWEGRYLLSGTAPVNLFCSF